MRLYGVYLDFDDGDVNINFHHAVNDEDRMLLEAWIDQQMPADLFAK